MPYPFFKPYPSPIPNLCNNGYNDVYCGFPFCDYYYDKCLDPKPDPDLCCLQNDCLTYDVTPYQDPSCYMQFTMEKLVSNVPEFARNLDPNLWNPWGIIVVNDIIWVTNTNSGFITSYTLTGKPLYPIINVFGPIGNIAQPTGIAYNVNIDAFKVVQGPIKGSSSFLIVTRDGTINGYNAQVDPNNSIMLVDNSARNSVYTGVAVANLISDLCRNTFLNNYLYAADFYNKRIDVYDGRLNRINNFLFIDEHAADPIPQDFAPNNVTLINDSVYVCYAKQNPDNNQYEQVGPGNGYISIFTYEGKFVRRFASRGPLNVPWGITLAPSVFGYPAGSVMVANFGSGMINIFTTDGQYLGNLRNECGNEICFKNPRGLTPNPIYHKILYWSGSENALRTGFIGSINSKLTNINIDL